MMQSLDAAVEEHVVVARRPDVGSFTVKQLCVHVYIDVLIARQLLHQRRQSAQSGRFSASKSVHNYNGAVLVLLVGVDDQFG